MQKTEHELWKESPLTTPLIVAINYEIIVAVINGAVEERPWQHLSNGQKSRCFTFALLDTHYRLDQSESRACDFISRFQPSACHLARALLYNYFFMTRVINQCAIMPWPAWTAEETLHRKLERTMVQEFPVFFYFFCSSWIKKSDDSRLDWVVKKNSWCNWEMTWFFPESFWMVKKVMFFSLRMEKIGFFRSIKMTFEMADIRQSRL